jgi:nitroimidazol reductase NimA-like FMN-containing flavoprotein (pyridoxamine 5'-phosphate oxidase superfamily)
MRITELTEDECLAVLATGRVARLGCAKDDQPYVVPIYYAFDRAPNGTAYLYGFTTVGQKVEWMRANPRVCIEWDSVARYDRWTSVVAYGQYEELPPRDERPEGRPPARAAVGSEAGEEDREWLKATELLREHATWWQPAGAVYATRTHRGPAAPFRAVYYRIRIERVTGHRAVPDTSALPAPSPAPEGRWRRTLNGLADVFSRKTRS